MPVIEFYCPACDRTQETIIPMREVTPDLSSPCSVCSRIIPRVLYSRTLEPHLYGDPNGYAKPSPTKRYSTKLATAKGNKDSVG